MFARKQWTHGLPRISRRTLKIACAAALVLGGGACLVLALRQHSSHVQPDEKPDRNPPKGDPDGSDGDEPEISRGSTPVDITPELAEEAKHASRRGRSR